MKQALRNSIDQLETKYWDEDGMFSTPDNSGDYLRKSDVIGLVEVLTKWNKLTDLPKEDNILVLVKTKHKIVKDYRGFRIANYAFGKFECYSENLIPVRWKLI